MHEKNKFERMVKEEGMTLEKTRDWIKKFYSSFQGEMMPTIIKNGILDLVVVGKNSDDIIPETLVWDRLPIKSLHALFMRDLVCAAIFSKISAKGEEAFDKIYAETAKEKLVGLNKKATVEQMKEKIDKLVDRIFETLCSDQAADEDWAKKIKNDVLLIVTDDDGEGDLVIKETIRRAWFASLIGEDTSSSSSNMMEYMTKYIKKHVEHLKKIVDINLQVHGDLYEKMIVEARSAE